MKLHKVYGVWQVDSMMPYLELGRGGGCQLKGSKDSIGKGESNIMRRKLLQSLVVIPIAFALLLIPAGAFAAAPVDASGNSEIALAKQSGQSFVNEVAATNPNLPKVEGCPSSNATALL